VEAGGSAVRRDRVVVSPRAPPHPCFRMTGINDLFTVSASDTDPPIVEVRVPEVCMDVVEDTEMIVMVAAFV